MNTQKLQNIRSLLRVISAFGVLTITCASVANAQVVVPNENANTAASTSGLNTFIRDVGAPRTGQLLINANQLTSLIGQPLGGISFRLWTAATVPFPATNATWSDFTITMGQGVAFGAQTTTFANNFVGAATTVRTGPLTINCRLLLRSRPGTPTRLVGRSCLACHSSTPGGTS